MRQRKIKDIEERLKAFDEYIIDSDQKGKWNRAFSQRQEFSEKNKNPIYLEVGCGKGKFLNAYALENPQNCYIGIEGHTSVILRALQKADRNKTNNILFICKYIDDLEDLFCENEIDGIYLNFSDPWPKKRHAKRRLTHTNFLKTYMKVIKPGGFIQFKTDNEELFSFTIEEIQKNGYKILEYTKDLHSSSYSAKEIVTEYEQKFMEKGKNINYVKIAVK